jgi:hypothetical protein
MTREEAFEQTLEAIASIQSSIALMLGAKAMEAEKVRNWMLEHLKSGTLESHVERLGASLQIHEQHIEVIDGLAKLCNGLSRSMRVILHPDETDDSGGMSFGSQDQGG